MNQEIELIKAINKKILADVKNVCDEMKQDNCDFYHGKHLAYYEVLLDIQSMIDEWTPVDTDEEKIEAFKQYGFDIDVDAYLKGEFKQLQ